MNKVPPAPGLLTPKSRLVLPHYSLNHNTITYASRVFFYSTSFIFFIPFVVSSLV